MSDTFKEKYLKTNKLTREQKDALFSKLRRHHEYEYRASDRLSERGFVGQFVFSHSLICRQLIRRKDRLARKRVLRASIKAFVEPS